MLDRSACERRVYRLAVLLTGNPNAATRVIAQVVSAKPDLTLLDSAHMDRLTVLRSREISPASIVSPMISRAIAHALADLTPQQREAWVFGRVYRTSLREMSRAMDCSSTAAERHLLQGDVAIRQATDHDPEFVAKQILQFSLSLEVPEFYRKRQAVQRRMKRLAVGIVIILSALVLAAIAIWWTRPLEQDSVSDGRESTPPPGSQRDE